MFRPNQGGMTRPTPRTEPLNGNSTFQRMAAPTIQPRPRNTFSGFGAGGGQSYTPVDPASPIGASAPGTTVPLGGGGSMFPGMPNIVSMLPGGMPQLPANMPFGGFLNGLLNGGPQGAAGSGGMMQLILQALGGMR